MSKQFNISISLTEMKETETFKKLSDIQKKVYLNQQSRIQIENGVNISLNRGFEVWKKQTKATSFIFEIVEELFTLKKQS